MKNALVCFCLVIALSLACAHDHIDVGVAAGAPNKLAVSGNLNQVATFFPVEESPSSYLASFPGGTYASELTFSLEGGVLSVPSPANVQIQAVAVSGPVGGVFSFWEVGASTATWNKPSGWTASGLDQAEFFASEDETGYGHIHGRAFSMSKEGVYDVTFRAVDALNGYMSSDPFVVRFTAINPPQLAISMLSGSIKLTFASRENLSYDVQSSTTLQSGSWTTIQTLDGSGGGLEFLEPLAGRPRVFYRLVEYP